MDVQKRYTQLLLYISGREIHRVVSGKITNLFTNLFLIPPLFLLQAPGIYPTSHPQAVLLLTQADSSNQRHDQRQIIAENFLRLLFTQQYEAATEYISPVVKTEFPPAVLRQKVEEFQRQAGGFVHRLDSQVEGDVALVNLLFERGERTFIVSFDENLNILNANYVLETSHPTPKN